MGKLTKEQQQIIGLSLFLLLGGGYFYFNYMLKPTLERVKTGQEKYNQLVKKIEDAERQARRLPALQNELAKLEIDLSYLEKQLPKDKDIPNIIRILTREALQEGLQFIKLGPKPLVRETYFEIIPFDLQFSGTLQGLARFLTSLGQQERIFRAQNITLAPIAGTDQQGVVNLVITLAIQTYTYAG